MKFLYWCLYAKNSPKVGLTMLIVFPAIVVIGSRAENWRRELDIRTQVYKAIAGRRRAFRFRKSCILYLFIRKGCRFRRMKGFGLTVSALYSSVCQSCLIPCKCLSDCTWKHIPRVSVFGDQRHARRLLSHQWMNGRADPRSLAWAHRLLTATVRWNGAMHGRSVLQQQRKS